MKPFELPHLIEPGKPMTRPQFQAWLASQSGSTARKTRLTPEWVLDEIPVVFEAETPDAR